MKPDIHEFKLLEMWNDRYGRTSPTKFCGWWACMVSIACFAVSAISIMIIIGISSRKDVDFTQVLGTLQNMMMNSVALFGLGTSLLAVQRLSKDNKVQSTEEINKEG
jgi:hypothetical protein